VNRSKWLVSLTLLALMVLLMASACSRKEMPGRGVMAAVNNKEITEAEIEHVYQRQVKGQPAQNSPDQVNGLKLSILNDLINDEILLQRAAKLGLNATDTEVENRLTDMKARVTEEEFQKLLKEQGYTLEELKNELRKRATIEKLINKEINSKITITDAQIGDSFNKNKQNFNFPPGYRVAHILVANAPDEVKLKERAQAAMNRIRSGEDFSSVAQQQSDDSSPNSPGGQITFISTANLLKGDQTVKVAVMGLKVGETSDLIKTKEGYLIIKLFEIERGGQHDLTDPRVQTSIRNDLIDQKNRLLQAAFSEDARNEAKIVNYLAKRVLENAGQGTVAEK
jgi:peptidyl-prolyl cis-trans isomerase SurA